MVFVMQCDKRKAGKSTDNQSKSDFFSFDFFCFSDKIAISSLFQVLFPADFFIRWQKKVFSEYYKEGVLLLLFFEYFRHQGFLSDSRWSISYLKISEIKIKISMDQGHFKQAKLSFWNSMAHRTLSLYYCWCML